MYVYNGHLSYVLPDGFEYVGDIINVGNLLTGLDFEGNCDGHIYMSKSDQSLVYFCWEEWDEEIDGKEPYLILYKGPIEAHRPTRTAVIRALHCRFAERAVGAPAPTVPCRGRFAFQLTVDNGQLSAAGTFSK